MEQKTQEERRREMEAEIAANEALEKQSRQRLIRNLIITAIIIVAGIGGYLALRPNNEPDVYYKDGDIDYVKQADKLRRTTNFKSVQEFRGGYAIVSDGKKYGVVDVKGNIVCPVKYDAIESNYSEHYPGLCQVRLNGKLGLVNKEGKEVVKPIYDDMGPISNGMIQVNLGDEEFYIDSEGKRME
ncbi:MAG: WG repeat-containing protein [Prevotella sp.]|jgi:hypothetical protein